MNNKIVNKQIPINKIIDVANYLEDYKDKYNEIFEKEKEKNKDLTFSEKNYEYENGSTAIKYTIAFYNGQILTESDYNWFIGNLNEPINWSIKMMWTNLEHSEVHFGKFWDAEKRRKKIEDIYKVTRIILLVQLVISVALFFVL